MPSKQKSGGKKKNRKRPGSQNKVKKAYKPEQERNYFLSPCKEMFARIKGQYSRQEKALYLDSEILIVNSTTHET